MRLAFVVSLLLAAGSKTLAGPVSQVDVLEKCLGQVSSPQRIESDLRKLDRYSEWTEEEVPCLMRCLASEKGWYDLESNKWHRQRLSEELGVDSYNYCRYELQPKSLDACSYAYRGLRCLKQAELYAGKSLSTLLHCSNQLNVTNEQLLQYSKLKPKESIPCLFECFAKALRFYDAAGNWQLLHWQQAFGPIRLEQQPNYSECRRSNAQRQLAYNECAWMYEEYLCWERLSGNLINHNNISSSNSNSNSLTKLI